MAKAADLGSRRLISLAPTALVRWILNDPAAEVLDILSGDFQWISRESDAVIRVHSPTVGEFLLLVEIQLHVRADMPIRIRAYAALAEERYRLSVVPVLVNILEPAATVVIADRYHSEFLGLTARQDYRVLNLWEVDARLVLESNLLPLLPFTPILHGGADATLLRQAVTLLRTDETLLELEPLLAFFASFVLETELVRQIMRWDMAILRESPWYYEILQEGVQQGIEQGLEQGVQKGLEQGIEQGLEQGLEQGVQKGLEQGIEQGMESGMAAGRHEAALQQLLRILRHRFSSLPYALYDALAALATEDLYALVDPALDAETLETFQASLPPHSQDGPA